MRYLVLGLVSLGFATAAASAAVVTVTVNPVDTTNLNYSASNSTGAPNAFTGFGTGVRTFGIEVPTGGSATASIGVWGGTANVGTITVSETSAGSGLYTISTAAPGLTGTNVGVASPTVTFNNAPVTVNVGTYDGQYLWPFVSASLSGNVTRNTPLGTSNVTNNYGSNNAPQRWTWSTDASGNVSVNSQPSALAGAQSVTTSGSTMTLPTPQNVGVSIPAAYSGGSPFFTIDFYKAGMSSTATSVVKLLPGSWLVAPVGGTVVRGTLNVPLDPEWSQPVVVTQNGNDFTFQFNGPGDDSTLSLSSTAAIDFGKVLVGSDPAAISRTLDKAGISATAYSVVAPTGVTLAPGTGAFAVGTGGQTVGIDLSTATARNVSGNVVVDNLAVTSAAAGQGTADADDSIAVTATILDPSEASFNASTKVSALTVDFLQQARDTSVADVLLSLFNLQGPTSAALTAALDLVNVSVSGDTGVLFITGLSGFDALAANGSSGFSAAFNTNVPDGVYQTIYTFTLADEAGVFGGGSETLTLTLQGEVVPEPAAAGVVALGVLAMLRRSRRTRLSLPR